MLKFSYGNSKINALAEYLGYKKREVVAFDLPAGYTCPAASICKTYANRFTGKMQKVGRVVCYAAKTECYAPSVRKMRWYNFSQLLECGKDIHKMAELIIASIPNGTKIIRIHSSGDFYSPEYFHAWRIAAIAFPEVVFFGYTKVLPYAEMKNPVNMFIQYSYGGKYDESLTKDTPTCYIGEYPNQYPYPVACADHSGAHEDYLAIVARKSFVINMH